MILQGTIEESILKRQSEKANLSVVIKETNREKMRHDEIMSGRGNATRTETGGKEYLMTEKGSALAGSHDKNNVLREIKIGELGNLERANGKAERGEDRNGEVDRKGEGEGGREGGREGALRRSNRMQNVPNSASPKERSSGLMSASVRNVMADSSGSDVHVRTMNGKKQCALVRNRKQGSNSSSGEETQGVKRLRDEDKDEEEKKDEDEEEKGNGAQEEEDGSNDDSDNDNDNDNDNYEEETEEEEEEDDDDDDDESDNEIVKQKRKKSETPISNEQKFKKRILPSISLRKLSQQSCSEIAPDILKDLIFPRGASFFSEMILKSTVGSCPFAESADSFGVRVEHDTALVKLHGTESASLMDVVLV